jgi:hypothetical protein
MPSPTSVGMTAALLEVLIIAADLLDMTGLIYLPNNLFLIIF